MINTFDYKKCFALAAFTFLCCTGYLCINQTEDQEVVIPKQLFEPRPTNGSELEKSLKKAEVRTEREAWFELIHNCAPGTDWKKIEQKNSLKQYQLNQGQLFQRDGHINIGNGSLKGRWIEKGSDNQSGSVRKTAYDPDSDKIFALADGGSIWKGSRNGTNWQVIQDDLRFDKTIFDLVSRNNDTKLIAAISGVIYTSDLSGQNWTKAIGFGDNYSQIDDLVVLNNGDLLVLAKDAFDSEIELLISEDLGASFSNAHTFNTSIWDQLALNITSDHENAFVILQQSQNSGQIYSWNSFSNVLALRGENAEINAFASKANLFAGPVVNSVPDLYRWDDNTNDNFARLYRSTNYGASWASLALLPKKPWDVGVYISKENRDLILIGEENCQRSTNGGITFDLINHYNEYYGDIVNKLHADIMDIDEFTTSSGTDFMLISTHGGISISYDKGNTNKNITLKDLNITQYYDVATSPVNPNWIFAGSQDQGFQRAINNRDGALSFQQVYGGDYGHLSFSDNGEKLWISYPGGWITYYNNPEINTEPSNSYNLQSTQESVWIPPIVPIPNENAILLAGGNLNGGSGSFLIKLTAESNNAITTSKFPFNFAIYGGEISAIAIDHFDQDIWYVSTTNGRFFKSENAGHSFEAKSILGPETDLKFLYGSEIYPSKTDPNIVYLAGSGYNNPAVYKSVDGGNTFNSMTFGLPFTTVFELVGNQDESLLFAATEAGPFVFIEEEAKWFNMSEFVAPNQTYWSVEFLEKEGIARFGTFGRGIWDFKIDESVNTTDLASLENNIQLYPNPATEFIRIKNKDFEQFDRYSIYSVEGSFIFEGEINTHPEVQIPIAQLRQGTYFILMESYGQSYLKKFVKI